MGSSETTETYYNTSQQYDTVQNWGEENKASYSCKACGYTSGDSGNLFNGCGGYSTSTNVESRNSNCK